MKLQTSTQAQLQTFRIWTKRKEIASTLLVQDGKSHGMRYSNSITSTVQRSALQTQKMEFNCV